MTITLDIQPEIERGLLAQAHARGLTLADYVKEIVVRQARASEGAGSASQNEAKSLFELFAPVRGLLTDDEIDRCFTRNPSTGRPVDFS